MTSETACFLRKLLAAVFLFIASSALNQAQAQITWDGSTDATWGTADNWTPASVPISGNSVIFSGNSTDVNSNTTIDLGGAQAVNNININTSNAAAYIIGAATDTLTFDSGGDIIVDADVTNHQEVGASLVLFGSASHLWQTLGAANLTISGNVDTNAGGGTGVAHIDITAAGGDVNLTGDWVESGNASRLQINLYDGTTNFTGNATAADSNLRLSMRNNTVFNINGTGVGPLGQYTIDYGTVNINSANHLELKNTVSLGHGTRGNGNSALNINSGATLTWSNGSINYIDDSVTLNTATVSGGTLQRVGNRAIIVHNHSGIAEATPELTISSNLTSDTGNRSLTVRAPDNEATGGTLLLTGNNSGGDLIVQGGIVQLGSDLAAQRGLTVSARNSNLTVENTTATIDIMGNTIDMLRGAATNNENIIFGNDGTDQIQGTNNFQSNIIDSVGGGNIINANGINIEAGAAGKLNGTATLNADVYFDASGNGKTIKIENGQSDTDFALLGNLHMDPTQPDDDFNFIGDGTLALSGTLNGHDQTSFMNAKTVIQTAAAANLTNGGRDVFVRQRESNTFNNFEVELDINGFEVLLDDDLQVSQSTTVNIAANGTLQSTRITDSAGGGLIRLTGDNDIIYHGGSGGNNRTTYISADLRFEGSAFTIDARDGADDVDLEISGRITDDNNGGRTLTKNGAGVLLLTNENNLYNNININAGTLRISHVGALGDDRIQLGDNAVDGIFEYVGSGGDIGAGGLHEIRIGQNAAESASGSILNNGTGGLNFSEANFNQARGSATAGATRVLTLGGNNTGGDNVIQGVIRNNNDGTGALVAINKTGSNTWVLNGNNLYTGNTTISTGRLDINGTNASNITVATGASLGGEGSTSGFIAFGNTSTLDGVDGSTTAALTTTNGTTGLDLTGVGVGGITVNILAGGAGDFTVLDYGGIMTGIAAGAAADRFIVGSSPTASARGAGGFVDTGSIITYNLGFVDNTWVGGVSGNWDVGTTANWNNSSDSVFQHGDVVIFDDTATTKDVVLTQAANISAGSLSTTGGNDYTFSATAPGTQLTTDSEFTLENLGTVTFGANVVIAGNGSIAKGRASNATGILTINGNNTYTGGTFLGEGRLDVGHNNALGTGTLTIEDNGTTPDFRLAADGLNIANDIILTNVTSTKIVRLELGGANTGEISGDISILETADWAAQFVVGTDDNLTLSGIISGPGTPRKFGQGTLTLTNANNSFTGRLRAGVGTISANSIADSGVNSAIGAGSNIVIGYENSDGVFEYTGGTASTNRQVSIGLGNTNNPDSPDTGSATINNNGTGALTFTNATFNLQDTQGLGTVGARSLTLGGSNTGGTNVIQGAILDNAGTDGNVSAVNTVSLVKEGTNSWELQGASSYTGNTQVNGGALLVNNSSGSATGSGDVFVNTGATLGGSGAISGNLTINAGGTHSAGATTEAGSIGQQNIGGGVTFSGAGTTVAWDLINNVGGSAGATLGTAGTDYDQFVLGGALTFDGSNNTTFEVNFNGTGSSVDWNDVLWDADAQWVIYTGASGITNGSMLNLSGGSFLDSNGLALNTGTVGSFALGTNGNDIVLNFTAIPEPSTYALMGIGLAAFGWVVRRRKRSEQ